MAPTAAVLYPLLSSTSTMSDDSRRPLTKAQMKAKRKLEKRLLNSTLPSEQPESLAGASASLRGGSPRHSKPRPRASLRTARNYLGLRYGDCYDFVCTRWRSSSDGGPSCRRRPGHTQRPSRRRCARTSTSTGTAARKLGGHIPTRPEYKHPFRLLRGPPHRRILSTSPKRACWRTTSHACE